MPGATLRGVKAVAFKPVAFARHVEMQVEALPVMTAFDPNLRSTYSVQIPARTAETNDRG